MMKENRETNAVEVGLGDGDVAIYQVSNKNSVALAFAQHDRIMPIGEMISVEKARELHNDKSIFTVFLSFETKKDIDFLIEDLDRLKKLFDSKN